MKANKSIDVFFELLEAGLWERDICLLPFGEVDFSDIYWQSEYQTVTGLIAAGFDHVKDVKVPQEDALTFAGSALQIEQRSSAMNKFIQGLIKKLNENGIFTILVKGQGLAQCYERPLWRNSGDIDLFLSNSNYRKAKDFLTPLASTIESEERYKKHIAMTIDAWEVELHGNLNSSLSKRIENGLEDIYNETFYEGAVRSWVNGNTNVYLLSVENDVIYVFVHILQHYFHGGIGLRQICDWCRLLWTYRDEIKVSNVEKKLRKMGLMTEWKAFAFFAVHDLGMPETSMPFYEDKKKWRDKAGKIKNYILKSGNFGHRDLSYVREYPYLKRKLQSFWNGIKGMFVHLRTFPSATIRFFSYYTMIRLQALAHGE